MSIVSISLTEENIFALENIQKCYGLTGSKANGMRCLPLEPYGTILTVYDDRHRFIRDFQVVCVPEIVICIAFLACPGNR